MSEPKSVAREVINAIDDGTITSQEVAGAEPTDPQWLTDAVEAAPGDAHR